MLVIYKNKKLVTSVRKRLYR